MQGSQSPAEDETRRLAHGARDQNAHLWGGKSVQRTIGVWWITASYATLPSEELRPRQPPATARRRASESGRCMWQRGPHSDRTGHNPVRQTHGITVGLLVSPVWWWWWWLDTYQQGQHLQHGDLGITQVGKEEDEGGDAQPIAKAGADGRAHQCALSLGEEHGLDRVVEIVMGAVSRASEGGYRSNWFGLTALWNRLLTITVPDVFMPCSRIATSVKTSIMGP